MQALLVGVVLVALLVFALVGIPFLAEKMENIEYARVAREQARVDLEYARAASIRAQHESWLYFSQAMFPWFVTFLIALGAGGLALFVAYRLMRRPELPSTYQPPPPTIIFISSGEHRGEALARVERAGYELESSQQLVVIDSRKER